MKARQAGAGIPSRGPVGFLLSRTVMAGPWSVTWMQLPFWPLWVLVRHAGREGPVAVIPHLLGWLCQCLGCCTKHSAGVGGAEGHGAEVVEGGGVEADFFGFVDEEVAADGFHGDDVGFGGFGEAEETKGSERPGWVLAL